MVSLLKKVALYSILIWGLTLDTSTFAQSSDKPLKKSSYPSVEEREEAKPTFQKLSEFGKKFEYLRSVEEELSAKIGYSNRTVTRSDHYHKKLNTEFNDLARKLLAENGIVIKPNEGIQIGYGFAGSELGYHNLPHSIHLTTYTLEKRTDGSLAMSFKNSTEYTFKKDSPNIEVYFINEKEILEPRPSIKRAK